MIPRFKEELELVPDQPGVYLFKNRAGKVIYVGKAISLRNRLRSYYQARESGDARLKRLLEEAVRFEYLVTASEVEALVLECNLIKEHRPKYNINLKDDKSYPYIRVTAEEFPRVLVTRRLVRDGSRYFGPYPDVGAVKETLSLLRKIFPYRSCAEKVPAPRSRPCLNGQIGKCPAPCTGAISPEAYRELISQVVAFLAGRTREVERFLEEKMEEAARALDFERAARLRDQLAALQKFREEQRVARASGPDTDVVALGTFVDVTCALVLHLRGGKVVGEEHYFLTGGEGLAQGEVLSSFLKQYYHGGREVPEKVLLGGPVAEEELLGRWLAELRGGRVEVKYPRRGPGRELVALALKNATSFAQQRFAREVRLSGKGRELLAGLKEALGLEDLPRRLECVDISHLGGRETVGAVVSFSEGRPDKSGYRRYRVRTAGPGDDYAALKEVLRRRFQKREANPPPDLLVVDGGKGQLNAALEVLSELGVSGTEVVSLAKEEEAVYRAGRKEPLLLPPAHPGLHLLQQARDEAHRFARTYQEQVRLRRARASFLDRVPGIGEKRKAALLRHFGSLKKMRAASVEELAAVPGMNRKVAAVLAEFLQQGVGEGERDVL